MRMGGRVALSKEPRSGGSILHPNLFASTFVEDSKIQLLQEFLHPCIGDLGDQSAQRTGRTTFCARLLNRGFGVMCLLRE